MSVDPYENQRRPARPAGRPVEPSADAVYPADNSVQPASGGPTPERSAADRPDGAEASPRTPARSAAAPSAAAPPAAGQRSEVTRAGVVWVSVAVALVVLVALIVFILQNQDAVLVRFLGMEGSVPLGMALFIAAVAGGVLVGVAGGVRIAQLRLRDHRRRQSERAATGRAR